MRDKAVVIKLIYSTNLMLWNMSIHENGRESCKSWINDKLSKNAPTFTYIEKRLCGEKLIPKYNEKMSQKLK